jgi:hypothetical protein
MATLLGNTPQITNKVYDDAFSMLRKIDDKGVPHFVRILEKKEELLASKLAEMSKLLALEHVRRIESKYKIQLGKEAMADMALDMYIVGWFNHLIADKAKDANWEKTWKEIEDAEGTN